MDTVRQMDLSLQRRSKAGAAAGGSAGGLTDSEKIFLQLSLDVTAFGREAAALSGSGPEQLPSFAQLTALVAKPEA